MSDSKKKTSTAMLLGLAGVWFTTHFGGGFASGAQMYSYYVRYGIWSLIMPTLAMAYNAFFYIYAFRYARKHELYDYGSYNKSFYGKYSPIFSTLFEVLYITVMCVAPAVAFATGGSTLENLTGLPYMLCTLIIGVFIFIVAIYGTDLVRRVSSVISICIIAGLLGANRMLGDVLNTQELLTLATSIEGHPDNVAPALLGGLTSSVFEEGKVYSVKRNVDETLCFAAIVPDYKLLTEAARAALPKEVSHKDAVYNLSRAALVPAAFCEGRHDLLAIATEDKLHQPYRMPLMPGSKEVFDMARLCGAKAVYVSGAGSTVMAVAEKAEAEKFYSKLEKGLELLEGLDGCEAFTLLRLDADNTGATVE